VENTRETVPAWGIHHSAAIRAPLVSACPTHLSRCVSSGVPSRTTKLFPGTRGGMPARPATVRPVWSACPIEQESVVGTRITTGISAIAPWSWEEAARED
jgi:hypothetical protein